MDAPKVKIYGLVAEFVTPAQIVDAANQAREAGYTAMEAYSPFPVMDLHEAVGFKRTMLPTLAFFWWVDRISYSLHADHLYLWWRTLIHHPFLARLVLLPVEYWWKAIEFMARIHSP